MRAGDLKLFFVNLLEHRNGKVVEGNVPLEQVLREEYKALIEVTDGVASWIDGDPVVGKFLQLDVVAYSGTDLSMNPADFEPGKERMTEMPWDRNNAEDVAAIKDARRREFHFGRSSGTDDAPWTIKTDDGGGLTGRHEASVCSTSIGARTDRSWLFRRWHPRGMETHYGRWLEPSDPHSL